MEYKKGEKVRVLCQYNLYYGTILSKGPKKYKVLIHGYNDYEARVLPEKIAGLEEKIVVIWKNGIHHLSNTYYIDRTKYVDFLVKSKYLPVQMYTEEESGVLRETAKDYLKRLQNDVSSEANFSNFLKNMGI